MDRCLRRHGGCDLQALRPQEDTPKSEVKTFKDDEPGFVHVDLKYLPQMPDEDSRRCLFAAIDRATRLGRVEILPEQSAACARGFLERLLDAAPFKMVDSSSDRIDEGPDQGIEQVSVGFSYTLAANLEELILTGTGNLSGTGNALDNRLTGNAENNARNGAGGADTLVGGLGNDTYTCGPRRRPGHRGAARGQR